MNHRSSYCALYVILALIGIFTSCKSTQKISGEYATQKFEIECLGSDHSGNLTLRTWGNGINRKKAIEQATRNAIETIIFTGIQGNGICDKRPLLTAAPNVKENFQDYFSKFFSDADKGYWMYVRIENKSTSQIKSKNSSMELWGCTVIVNCKSLRERLVTDGIIN